LEAERKSIIEQRVPPLNVSGMSIEQLKAKAKELHDLLFRIEGENYDLGQRFKRQSYDMQELAERARQMNKGRERSWGWPMVVMYSQYERVKDPRSFKERRTVFAGENYVEEFQRIAPKHQIVMTDEGFQVVSGGDGDSGSHAAPAEVAAAE
uniref:tRNA-synt_1d domain-containing protein n=1 Tax=Echinostoma caproni TaxID=27848 RepID=A0A183B1X5_9TREM